MCARACVHTCECECSKESLVKEKHTLKKYEKHTLFTVRMPSHRNILPCICYVHLLVTGPPTLIWINWNRANQIEISILKFYDRNSQIHSKHDLKPFEQQLIFQYFLRTHQWINKCLMWARPWDLDNCTCEKHILCPTLLSLVNNTDALFGHQRKYRLSIFNLSTFISRYPFPGSALSWGERSRCVVTKCHWLVESEGWYSQGRSCGIRDTFGWVLLCSSLVVGFCLRLLTRLLLGFWNNLI